MKKSFPFIILLCISTLSVRSQSRFSVAPTYWYNYGQYSYQLRSSYGSYAGRVHNSSFGPTVRYSVGSKWDVSAGLLYNIASLNDGGRRYTDDYVRLPVLFNYRLSYKRLSPYVSVGASFSNEYQFANNRGIKTNALLGLGANYRLGPKASLLVQPTVSYLVNRPKDQNEFDKYYFYQIGLQAQFIWHL